MQYFRGAAATEVIAVRVDAGEDLVAQLNQVVADCQIAAGAIVSGCGSLEHAHLEVPATMMWPSTVLATEKQGPCQIISAQGHVVNGLAELYLTVVKRNELLAGRAMPGTRVLHSAEFTLLRAGNSRWVRTSHPETGVPLLQAISAPAAGRPISLMGRPVDPHAMALVPPALLRKHMCLPVARSGDTLIVAMTDPNNPFAIDELREVTGLRIQAVGVDGRELVPALQQALGLPPG